jgi:hypothetical protein
MTCLHIFEGCLFGEIQIQDGVVILGVFLVGYGLASDGEVKKDVQFC